METGLDWKQQERKKEIRCSAHLFATPPLCLSPSEILLFKHAMHFQTNYRFSMEPGELVTALCVLQSVTPFETFKGKSADSPRVLFSAQTAPPHIPPARTATATTTLGPPPISASPTVITPCLLPTPDPYYGPLWPQS